MEKQKYKLEEFTETKKIIIGTCPFCKRRVRGITEEQVNWNLTLHINQKHPLELQDLEKETEGKE